MGRQDDAIIFDFDGTLADVSNVVRKVYGEMAIARGWPELTDRDYKKLRKGSITQAVRWVGIRPWQIPGLLREGRELLKKRSSEIELFKGVNILINQLHKSGISLYVLSSNSESTVRSILKKNDVSNIHILRRSSLFGKHKSIKKLVGRQNYDKNRVWMVGDELRDIEGAKKAGVRSIAVSWGLQDISVLKKAGPDYIAKKPEDIAKFINENAKKRS